LHAYEIGKPLVVEEIYPLNGTVEDTEQFIDKSQTFADGWITFYWGETIEECRRQGDLEHSIMADWLKRFSIRAKQCGKQRAKSLATRVLSTTE
jgi:hypothetical protein